MKFRAYAAAILLVILALSVTLLPHAPSEKKAIYRGRVTDLNAPVANARVRLQGTSLTSSTNQDGLFRLLAPRPAPRRITAWKKRYAIAAASVNDHPLRLSLLPLPQNDNPDYRWIDPAPHPNQPNNCGNCHSEIHREWAESAHGRSATNRRFLNLFAGTDWHGKSSPIWNLLKEHPLGSGVCATCHAPTFRDPHLEYDMRKVAGVAVRGVHCDFCHKIADAPIDNLGVTFGKDGYQFLRPDDDKQLFFGPLDDAFRAGEMFAYSPLYKDSRYCASCHEGVVFGVHVYGTYTEWLKSPARKKGLHCQNCHMRPTGAMTNIAPGKGGIERDPKTLASHDFPGATLAMLRSCLKLDIQFKNSNEPIVEVTVLAHNVGHRVPTGFIDRNLLLAVEAFDAAGNKAALKKGTTLPKAAGKDLNGAAGKLYAKLLYGSDGSAPAPFWLPHSKIVDTRLLPGQPDVSRFEFAGVAKRIRVQLIYRSFWDDVAQSKQWPKNSITVIDSSKIINSPKVPSSVRSSGQ